MEQWDGKQRRNQLGGAEEDQRRARPRPSATEKSRLPRPNPVKSVKTFSPIACPLFGLRSATMPANSGCVMS